MVSYTAKYTKISSGYMGQLVEWPEVVTEGRGLEDCRKMPRDALNEMVIAYRQMGKEIPLGNGPSIIDTLADRRSRLQQFPWHIVCFIRAYESNQKPCLPESRFLISQFNPHLFQFG